MRRSLCPRDFRIRACVAAAGRGLRSLAVGVLLVMAMSKPALAQDGVLPRDLGSIAASIDCRAVPDFYSRDGMIGPPFVYGVAAGNPESSAGFWCYRPSVRSTHLVIVRNARVVAEFSWWNFPDGLSVVELTNVDLTGYRHLGDPERLATPQTVARARAVRSEYGGSYTLFLEVGGTWYFRIFD